MITMRMESDQFKSTPTSRLVRHTSISFTMWIIQDHSSIPSFSVYGWQYSASLLSLVLLDDSSLLMLKNSLSEYSKYLKFYWGISKQQNFQKSGPSPQQMKESSFDYFIFGTGWGKGESTDEKPTKKVVIFLTSRYTISIHQRCPSSVMVPTLATLVLLLVFVHRRSHYSMTERNYRKSESTRLLSSFSWSRTLSNYAIQWRSVYYGHGFPWYAYLRVHEENGSDVRFTSVRYILV